MYAALGSMSRTWETKQNSDPASTVHLTVLWICSLLYHRRLLRSVLSLRPTILFPVLSCPRELVLRLQGWALQPFRPHCGSLAVLCEAIVLRFPLLVLLGIPSSKSTWTSCLHFFILVFIVLGTGPGSQWASVLPLCCILAPLISVSLHTDTSITLASGDLLVIWSVW